MTQQLVDSPDLNSLWATLLVEELVRQGVRAFAIAPGSRSTPLVLAAVAHPEAQTVLCLDERGAGFFAVGHARATGRPAAVITTSGTAVANLLPSVVEAHNDLVPLIVLSADRPPELRACGANQAIEQVGLMTPFVRFVHDLGCPTDAVPGQYVLGLAAQAVRQSTGSGAGVAGPVQLNCPFREPLAPVETAWDRECVAGLEEWTCGPEPWVRLERGSDGAPQGLVERIASARSGVIIVGAIPVSQRTGGAAKLAARLGWPLVPDVRSGVRLGVELARPHWRAEPEDPPELVLQFGSRLTDKALQQWLDASGGNRVLVTRNAGRDDPGHSRLSVVIGSPDRVADGLLDGLQAALPPRDASPSPRELSIRAELSTRLDTLDGRLSEPFVARWLSQHLPPDSGLFVSSSLPIRDIQNWAVTDAPHLVIDSNRGASGIDGVLATAIGFATGLDRPTTLLIGDLALLHDLNSLALLATSRPDLRVVVLNNGGGSIFSTLPIAAHTEVFTPWFDGAHSFGFEHAAKNFDLPYQRVSSRPSFAEAMQGAGPRVIEVASSQEQNRADQTELRRLLAPDA